MRQGRVLTTVTETLTTSPRSEGPSVAEATLSLLDLGPVLYSQNFATAVNNQCCSKVWRENSVSQPPWCDCTSTSQSKKNGMDGHTGLQILLSSVTAPKQ